MSSSDDDNAEARAWFTEHVVPLYSDPIPVCHKKFIQDMVDDIFESLRGRRRQELLEDTLDDIKRMDAVLIRKVGNGSFGSVYEARTTASSELKQNTRIAIKIIDLETQDESIITISREILALANISTADPSANRNLVKYLQCKCLFESLLFITMEFLAGGSVFDRLKTRKTLSEPEVAFVARGILNGLAQLERVGRVHRDIKAANVVLTEDGRVKLADFGACTQLTDTMKHCKTFKGSPHWMAPEILLGKYDGKADIWALGITCIEMAHGQPPHEKVHHLQILQLTATKPSPQLQDHFSLPFKRFVAACLHKDSKKRSSIQQLLEHPFITAAANFTSIQQAQELGDQKVSN